MEEIRARHRLELKANQAEIQALKKSIPKGDKKKKKEVQTIIEALEHEIRERHQREIIDAAAISAEQAKDADEVSDTISKLSLYGAEKPIKVSKQQQRKAKKQAQLEEIRRQAEEEASSMPKRNELEARAIEEQAKPLGLRVHEIPPDGNCLFSALSHQLSLIGKTVTFQDLRQLAANYIREHKDDFLPFMNLDNDAFESYCSKMENTACWGGQLEIQAISSALKINIGIIQQSSPIINFGEYNSERLMISFHKYAYTLGNHYNSLIKDEN